MARASSEDRRPPQRLGVARVRSAYDQVADQLRALITTGALSPGDRLPTEPELCQAFGVSRSTVREALRSLTSQNLVYTSRGVTGGTFVANTEPRAISAYLETSIGLLSADILSIGEMLAVREILEVPAARLAAANRSDTDIVAMRTAVEREASGADTRHEAPQDFHSLLLASAHNSLLEIVTQPIFSVLQTRFLRDTTPPELWAEVGKEHQVILDAVVRGDEDGAASAMKEHLLQHHGVFRTMDRFAQQDSH